jgi:hypothetical protein
LFAVFPLAAYWPELPLTHHGKFAAVPPLYRKAREPILQARLQLTDTRRLPWIIRQILALVRIMD